MIYKQLFDSLNLRLIYINPEEDSKIEAAWTYDLDYAQDLMEMPARPLGPVEIKKIPNPRLEAEEHYYNPTHTGLLFLGLQPHYLTEDVLVAMLKKIIKHKDAINKDLIYPQVKWQ